MITKERLEDLIKENKKVYYTQNHPLTEDAMWIDLTGAEIIPPQECVALSYKIYNNYGYVNCFPFKWLYETEEDARWELEMTVTRTETLKLPTWKQFRKGKIILFIGKDKNAYNLTTFSHTLVKDKKLEVYNMTDNKILFEKPLTKENYIEACKLCLRLFKGE